MRKLNNIFQRLGINTTNGLYYTNDATWKLKLQFPSRIERLLENSIKPDAFFCIDNKPLILFFENPNDMELHKKIWNFNETPIVIIVKNNIVEIFNGFKYEKQLKKLAKIDSDKLTDFTYFNLFTNQMWEKYQEHFKHENRLDYFLLHNIKAAHDILKEQIETTIANALIGKCIFVRYLIDRGVYLSFEGKRERWKNEKFCEILRNVNKTRKFFNYLKKKFNGDDIFTISNNEYTYITKDTLNVLVRLLEGEDLKRGQPSFFSFYDFSIIPIEFISNIYELFIGKEDQENKGAYYTPLFLVDYILKDTVEKHFENNPEMNSCVTLDPACGSGIFLVETLRKIIEQYQKNNKRKKLTPNILRKIASENIYGIDKDPNAIQVAMFSIYLTLLDYQDPADIEKFQFVKLKDTNFFEADFFDTNPYVFQLKLQEIDLDFIIGNPPWKGGALGEYGKTYIKERSRKEKVKKKKCQITINNGEIVEGFVLRVSDFSKTKTRCAFIVRSTILYNRGYNADYSGFRRYWLEEFFVNKIVELALVRREVFDKIDSTVIAPAAILFYQYANGMNTDSNVLEHITIKPTRFFSSFKIFTINRPDYKQIEQNLLKQYDWLLKTLVNGSHLDFCLIARLKKCFPSIEDIISDETKFVYGTGMQYSKNPVYDATAYHGYPFVDAYAIEPYFVNPDKIGQFKELKVHRIRDEQLFTAPMLLIRKGPDTKQLIPKSAICKINAVYKDTLAAVKVRNKSDVKYLRNIEAILNSDIYTYFAINTFSKIAIEREQLQNYDKFSVPYVECNVIELVKIIEKSKAELHNIQKHFPLDNIKCFEIQNEINKTQNEINKTIREALNLNEVEEAVLDYALNISRPLITRTQTNRYEILDELQEPLSKQEIINYANVYLNRFKHNINNNERKFIVRIWRASRLLGMFFDVVPINTPEENGIVWEDVNDEQMLSLLLKMSFEKITDKLFVQKDIRGFEKETFFIFKPNEKKLWHKAIAYLDVQDFMDAILSAGRSGQ
jgi:hypothetical protein